VDRVTGAVVMTIDGPPGGKAERLTFTQIGRTDPTDVDLRTPWMCSFSASRP
jgi:hypothetical protein